MKRISPIKRSKSQARHYYDRISKIYDLMTSGEKGFIQKGVALLKIKPTEKIIDIGCGTGTGLKYIRKELSRFGSCIGIDLSHQMLLESKEKIESDSPCCNLVQGDGTNLPLEQDQFDGILCSFTLELFSQDDISTVLDELRRVLRDEGRCVFVALAQEPQTLVVNVYEWLHEQFPVAIDCRPIPLTDLLLEHGYKILDSTTMQYWGLSIKIVLSQPV